MIHGAIVAAMLLLAFLVGVILPMRAWMFWCPKCKTYHYKSVAPARCYRDYCERVARREARLRRVSHALHRR